MTLLDLDQLATVTGGRGCAQQQQLQPQQQDAQDPGGAPQQGGSIGSGLAGLDQFLSFFQSEGFQQILGGLRGILGQFGGAQQQPQAQPQQAAQ